MVVLSVLRENLLKKELYVAVVIHCHTIFTMSKFKDIFLIMDCKEMNLNSIFSMLKPDSFSELHVLTITYNLLCALNFLHSANVMH